MQLNFLLSNRCWAGILDFFFSIELRKIPRRGFNYAKLILNFDSLHFRLGKCSQFILGYCIIFQTTNLANHVLGWLRIQKVSCLWRWTQTLVTWTNDLYSFYDNPRIRTCNLVKFTGSELNPVSWSKMFVIEPKFIICLKLSNLAFCITSELSNPWNGYLGVGNLGRE